MLTRVGEYYRLSVHATPGAKRTHVGGSHDGALRVSVTAVADQGKANKAITKAIADALQIRKSQIALSSGLASRRKQFLLSDVAIQVIDRVAELAQMR